MNPVLTVIDPFDPQGLKIGGAETFLRSFLRHAPPDFDLRFIGLATGMDPRRLRDWSRIRLSGREFSFFPVLIVRDENTKGRIPLSLRFHFALRAARIDLSHGVLLFNRFESAWHLRASLLPKIAFIHNDIPRQILTPGGEVLWSRWPAAYLQAERQIIPSFDVVFTPCTASIDHFKRRFPKMAGEGKFRLFHPMIDPDVFFPLSGDKAALRLRILPDRENFQGRTKWVLFSGRLQEQKAPLRLLDILTEMRRSDPQIRLIVTGTGNLQETLENAISERRLGPCVHMAGRIDQNLLADFYRASDALILTSLYEGLPFCIVEALGCGLPVVTTRAGEVGRIVINGFSGEIVEEYSPRAMAAALERVMAHPDAHSKDNCLKAVTDFTPAQVLDPIYQCVRDLQPKTDAVEERP